MTSVKLLFLYYFPYKLAQNQLISLHYGRPKQEQRKKKKNKTLGGKIQGKSVKIQGNKWKKGKIFQLSLRSLFLKHFFLFSMVESYEIMMNPLPAKHLEGGFDAWFG